MGGTLRGKVDCYINTGSQFNNAQNVFKNIYDFCIAHPNMTLIARHGGLSSTAASVDYHDGANPFLSNAWFVVRMNDATLENGSPNPYSYTGTRTFPWYMYVQWSRGDVTSAWNAAPASPSGIDGTTTTGGSFGRVGVQFCIPVGTTPGTSEVAWNGGGTLGQNTKGTPVWRTTAGTPSGFQGSFVFPRSNNVGGTHSASRENCSSVFNSGGAFLTPVRHHVIADDDSIMFLTCQGDDHTSWQFNYFGMYTPRPGLTINYPMINVVDGGLPWLTTGVFGNTTGTVGGGVPMNSVANGVRGHYISRIDELLVQNASPNRSFSDETFDLWGLPIVVAESPWVGYVGTVGQSPLSVYETFGFGAEDTNSTKTAIAVGASASPLELKLIVPWNGTTFHRSNYTRAGVSF